MLNGVQMDIKKGTHGTCLSRAEEIKKNGFKSSGKGRGGPGVYFWRGHDERAKILAIGWYKHRLCELYYDTEKKQGLSVIYVLLKHENNEFLDLEKPTMKDKVEKLRISAGISNIPNNSEIALLWNRLVISIEKKIGQKFKILALRCTTPPKEYVPNYPLNLLGLPICYIVRDSAIIEIVEEKDIKI